MLPKDYTKSSKFFERNYAVLTATVASLGAFCIGSCIAWSSNAINILSLETFPLAFEDMSTTQVSWIVSIFALGATLSPMLVYKVWRFIGSKFFILTASGFLLTSWMLLALYENLITILCARLLAGVAVGCLHFIIPVYIEDIASAELRTRIDYIWNTQLAAGMFLQFIAVYFGEMHLINIVSGIAPVLLFIAFIFLPESPRYLCIKGQTNAAKEVLRKFREIGDEVEADIHVWCNKKLEDTTFRYILRNPSDMRRLLPTFALIIFDQLIGAWAAFFYMSWIFRVTGGEYTQDVTTIIIAGIFLLSIPSMKFLGISLSDKKTLITTGIMMSIALIILGLYLHERGSYGNVEDYGYLPLVCYGIFIYLYGIGMCRISWKYIRILTPKRRYFAIRALCTALSWLMITIFTRTYPRLIETVGVGWLFWFMAFSCFLLSIFTIIFIPDLDSLCTKYIFDDEYDNGSQNECEQQRL